MSLQERRDALLQSLPEGATSNQTVFSIEQRLKELEAEKTFLREQLAKIQELSAAAEAHQLALPTPKKTAN